MFERSNCCVSRHPEHHVGFSSTRVWFLHEIVVQLTLLLNISQFPLSHVSLGQVIDRVPYTRLRSAHGNWRLHEPRLCSLDIGTKVAISKLLILQHE